MAGVRPLRKLQLARETTAGTLAAATTVWRGKGTIENGQEVQFDEEDVGLLTPTDRSHTNFKEAHLTMDKVTATFEQIAHLFEASLKQVGTGAADGSGSGKIYSYPIPTSAIPTLQTYTIEGGDNQQAEVMEYAFVQKFTIGGEAKKAITMEADWFGRQVAKQAFTGAVAIPAVEAMAFQLTKFYADAASSTFGNTQKTPTLLAWDVTYNSGIEAVFTDGGNLYFSFTKMVQPTAELNLTFEHDTNAIAQKDNWIAETPQLLRLLVEGSALTTAGTAYQKKSLIIDLAGKFEKFEKLDEINGNDVLKAKFKMGYDLTPAVAGKFLVVNQLTTAG